LPEKPVILVTGASRGIGRAIALEFARGGACVAINFRQNAAAADSVAAEIAQLGGEAILVPGDVADGATVAKVFDQVVGRWGRLDVLVNNAGIVRDTLLLRMSEDDWDKVLGTNLRSAFLCTRAALRLLLRQRSGRIINISSISGLRGNAGQANYSASKAALIGFTKTVAREAASRGVTVNAVAPGLIETDIVSGMPEKAREALVQQIPLGRLGTAEEVASLVGFLASDKAGYITGQTFVIDGGLAI